MTEVCAISMEQNYSLDFGACGLRTIYLTTETAWPQSRKDGKTPADAAITNESTSLKSDDLISISAYLFENFRHDQVPKINEMSAEKSRKEKNCTGVALEGASTSYHIPCKVL